MRLPRSPRPRSIGMNITPMIDMAFLLITFFVMTIRLGLAGAEQVELPRADQARRTHERQLLVVTLTVDEAGRLLWDGREMGLDGLEGRLATRVADGADLKVVMRADARAPFERIERVMRSVALAGVTNLALSALKLGEDTP